jgi:hypothetical protein
VKIQTWTWILVAVVITSLTGMAYGAAPTSPARVAEVHVQHGWLCVGPMGSFRESFEVPGSSLALTAAGNPLVVAPTVKMPQPRDFHIVGWDFRRCW